MFFLCLFQVMIILEDLFGISTQGGLDRGFTDGGPLFLESRRRSQH